MSVTLRNARLVTPGGVCDDVSLTVEEGRIAEMRRGRARHGVDLRGLFLLPGLIDTHSDGLEKEISPRRTARFPLDYAIGSFEGRVRAAGVTTLVHGVGYQDNPRAGRSIAGARDLHAEIIRRQRDPAALADHRVLYRMEAREDGAIGPLMDDLASNQTGVGQPPALVSFEDHTPGQGQYRDPAQYAAAIDPAHVPAGSTVEEHVADIIAAANARLEVREATLRRLSAEAHAGQLTLLAHDLETVDEVEIAHEAGASVAEFPVTLEAAQAARERGMAVVMGAPNVLRGGSHSGNASARQVVAEGCCTALASDYMPSALLAAVFMLAAENVCDLTAAVGLVTRGPSELIGEPQRGVLAEGAVADLVLVDDRAAWPQVVGVHRADDPATVATLA